MSRTLNRLSQSNRSGKADKVTKAAKSNKRAGRNVYTGKAKKEGGWSWPGKLKFSLPRMGSLKGFLGFVLCVSIGSAALVGIGVGSLWGYRLVTTSTFFATRQVDVAGNVRLSREMVQDLAGVHVGDNSLKVSIAKVERSLLQTPWVEEVSVKRLLPDRFVIKVQERMPSFWVRKDGVLYYADARATIIAPVETSNFMSLPTLEVEAGAEDELAGLEGYLKDLKSGRFPVEFGAVSGLHISPGKGIELYLDDREMRLSIATDDWPGNLERLSITLGDLARRNELGVVREIRAADGNVWVIKNKS